MGLPAALQLPPTLGALLQVTLQLALLLDG